MAEVVVIEFAAPEALELYRSVNRELGIDPDDGSGDWPVPLVHHIAGQSDGKLVVVEIWDSKEGQEEFMPRLQAAFEAAKVPPPARVEWFHLVGQMHRG